MCLLSCVPVISFHPLPMRRRPLRLSATPAPGFDPSDFDLPDLNGLTPKTSKSDLYSDEELQQVLELHQLLSDGTFEPTSPEDDSPVPPGLHEMVLGALEEMEARPNDGVDESVLPGLHEMVLGALEEMEVEAKDAVDESSVNPPPVLTDDLRTRILQIRAIASDVDGTLIGSDQTVHPHTLANILEAVRTAQSPVQSLQYFFPATGKSRQGALTSLGPEIAAVLDKVPGVFIQGLYCVDADGTVIFEKKLSVEEVAKVEEMALETGVSLFAYDGDTMYASRNSDPKLVAEVHEKWGEPLPIVVEDSLASLEKGFHKCLVMNEDTDKISNVIRPRMEAIAEETGATVTQAIDTMMEFLPSGCSKGHGVRKLCEALGIDMDTQLLAIGDAENDAGMLREACVGVAVGNACPAARAAADIVLPETNDQGGAGVAIEQYGLGKILR